MRKWTPVSKYVRSLEIRLGVTERHAAYLAEVVMKTSECSADPEVAAWQKAHGHALTSGIATRIDDDTVAHDYWLERTEDESRIKLMTQSRDGKSIPSEPQAVALFSPGGEDYVATTIHMYLGRRLQAAQTLVDILGDLQMASWLDMVPE